MENRLKYQTGFGNHFSSEAISGTLPLGQNSPQKTPHGLYAEQLSGSAFTASRAENQRSWLYRILPSVVHQGDFQLMPDHRMQSFPLSDSTPSPQPLRLDAIPNPTTPTDFLSGIVTLAGNGDFRLRSGCAIHAYVANKSMESYFYNADGELLIVPQLGQMVFLTEMGGLELSPGEALVIQRGIKFQVVLRDKLTRGYICENYGPPLRLPNLGPIGANGLANPRDFLTPEARFEDRSGRFDLFAKFHGALWRTQLVRSPLDVVAWHGNYAPYKYPLHLFQAVNTVSFDHSDPSIFTVLTSPSEFPGTANIDFVIFPPRWLVAENTFRPPYYHRNVMSEFMGLISGVYEVRKDGFNPGASTLHNCMTGHGPDAETFEKAIHSDLKPVHLKDGLAFMFESRFPFILTPFSQGLIQKDYSSCWKGLTPHYSEGK